MRFKSAIIGLVIAVSAIGASAPAFADRTSPDVLRAHQSSHRSDHHDRDRYDRRDRRHDDHRRHNDRYYESHRYDRHSRHDRDYRRNRHGNSIVIQLR